MNKRKEEKKKMLFLAEKIQLSFSEESLKKCHFFSKVLCSFWKENKTFFKKKKEKNIEKYLKILFCNYKKFFLTLNELKKISKDFYDTSIDDSIWKKNSPNEITKENFIFFKFS